MNNSLFKDSGEKVLHIINKIQKEIKGSYFEGHTFVVGGCVRNAILGKPIKDIDIVVDVRNGGVSLANFLAFRDKCYKPAKNPVIFPNYGTAKLNFTNDEVCKDINIEIVQTRKLHYGSSSQNTNVVFGTLEEDAKLRDLTINSIYYNISSETIVDPNHGIQDIKDKVLKTPTDPFITFTDDALRMMRVIRFATSLGWGIEKNTWLGILENSHRIGGVSKERVADELSKILLCDTPSVGLTKLYHASLLHRIIPDIYDLTKVFEYKAENITLFDHTLKVLDDVQPILEHRLAALFHDIGCVIGCDTRTVNINKFSGEVAASDLKELKFSNNIIKNVETAIANHKYFAECGDDTTPSDKKIRKFINTCGDSIAIALDVMNANNTRASFGKKPRQVFNIINRMEELEKAEEVAKVKLPIDGDAIMKEFNLRRGPIIGTILNEIKEAYFENPNITKDECFGIAEAVLKKVY